MFFSDVFKLLLEYSDVRTLVNIGLTSTEHYAALTDMMKCYRRAGTTILYPRQADAIDELSAKIAAGERKIVFSAPMSFGKTLVAIELARAYAKSGVVFVVIPQSIEVVWKKEIERFYPKMIGKGKVAERMVLFATSRQAAQRKFVESLVATPSLLCGRIIITNSFAAVYTSVASLVIKDEGHLNAAATTEFITANPSIPCIIMGASEGKIVASERVSFQNTYLAVPEVNDEIIHRRPGENAAADLANESTATHIVVALPSAGDAQPVIESIKNKRVYDYTTRSVRALDTFTRDGGVLVTSIRMIAEGNNFNKCAHMIILLPYIKVGNVALISLRRIQQVRNRICRQSSNHTSVTVTYVTNHSSMLARAMLARTDANGYDIVERSNLCNIVTKIMPIHRTLSFGELAILLAAPVEAHHSITPGVPVLSAAELINICTS